ncbi:MAG TPA: VOC family protein [Micromonosporaceae bacterium]
MKIMMASLLVDDQEKALRFYTDVLGFVKKNDIPVGDAAWLTVVSPAGPDGVELLLEPNRNPVTHAYQQGVYQAGIPATTFASDDVHADYARLRSRGVQFLGEPTTTEFGTAAVFDDTCGNLIAIHQP